MTINEDERDIIRTGLYLDGLDIEISYNKEKYEETNMVGILYHILRSVLANKKYRSNCTVENEGGK